MDAIEEPRRQGRPKREEVTKTERRRRAVGTVTKLTVPQSIKDKYPDMEFRWGRDDGDRMQQLTQNDDWDAVPGIEPIHAGRNGAGAAMKQHLLMKPKSFMKQDVADKLARIDATDQAQLARPETAQAEQMGAEFYSVPGNKI